jgi:hypothetical protein
MSHPALWREPCWDAVLRLGSEAVAEELGRLGDARFAERSTVLATEIERGGREGALYRALLEAVAYGGDRAAFQALGDALPWPALAKRLPGGLPDIEALLLGAAGLLPSQQGRPPAREREERWELVWSRAATTSGPPPDMPAGRRPAAHPARRLAGLAALLSRHGPAFVLDLSGETADLITGWSVAADAYWRRVRAPGQPTTSPAGALIGRSRAIELLANAVLPWAAAQGGEPAALARRQYARLPRPAAYGRLRFLEANLVDRSGKPLRLNARLQQGLLALYKSECTQGGCGRCAFS